MKDWSTDHKAQHSRGARVVPPKRRGRHGASLLEALIATVILLISVAALTSQALVGVQAANRAQLRAMAKVICQSVLAELIATKKLPGSSAIRVPGVDGWMAQTNLAPVSDSMSSVSRGGMEQLCQVSVTVWQIGRGESLSRTTLTQIVRFPTQASSNTREALKMP